MTSKILCEEFLQFSFKETFTSTSVLDRWDVYILQYTVQPNGTDSTPS